MVVRGIEFEMYILEEEEAGRRFITTRTDFDEIDDDPVVLGVGAGQG